MEGGRGYIRAAGGILEMLECAVSFFVVMCAQIYTRGRVELNTYMHIRWGSPNWLANCANVSILDGTLYHCCTKCYYWGKLGKIYTESLSIISYTYL